VNSACGRSAYGFVLFCRSDLSKDQMIVDLSIKTKILFWGGVALGSMSVGILGYAVVRYVGLTYLSIYYVTSVNCILLIMVDFRIF